MGRFTKGFIATLLLAGCAGLTGYVGVADAAAEPGTPNDVARWLAGMNVGTPVDSATAFVLNGAALHRSELGAAALRTAAVSTGAGVAPTPRERLDRAWAELATTRTAPMRGFAAQHLAHEQQNCRTLFYPFSGPDVLNAVTLFPSCETYVMFGLEPVGALPHLDRMTDESKAAVLADMVRAQNFIIKRNFFVTQYMREDLNTPHLKGVLPLMSAMLVRMGYEVRDVRMSQVDGTPWPAGSPKRPRAVTIDFGRPGGPDQHLFYANFDASNGGLKTKPDFLHYLDGVHDAVTLLKAASYLLHDGSFSVMRDQIEQRSAAIVQDDSGLPYASLTSAGFSVELYGNYVGTIPVFKYRYQRDLAGAYVAAKEREPLPFAWSYAVKRNEEALQIARRPGA
ncbi:MAG TPA: hypothetical protein VMU33_07165 [Burkholderiaceae bacterium]|nr:hypothetical protein [Burkholderiaceae bacterium]